MAIRRAAGTIGLLLACAVVLAPSQRAQLNVEAFRTRILKILADGAAPSLAVAVARNGEIVWSDAFGFADREARVAATVETPYSIASLTKPFTATALKHASVPERAGEAVTAAKRYGRDGSLLPFYVTDFPGGSAIFASVEDVVRFGSFHAGALMAGQRAVLTPASLAAMQQQGTGDYGLGWSVNPNWNTHTVIWHSGAMPGSAATLWLVPAEKIAIAVVANQIAAPVNQLAGEILTDLLLAGRPAAGSPAQEEAKPSTPVPDSRRHGPFYWPVSRSAHDVSEAGDACD
jgi:CubicO group peptidase (beta-lactamase class C family)